MAQQTIVTQAAVRSLLKQIKIDATRAADDGHNNSLYQRYGAAPKIKDYQLEMLYLADLASKALELIEEDESAHV